MNELQFRALICFVALGIFYIIPIAKNILGEPFSDTQIILSILLGLGFGLYGIYLVDKIQQKKKRDSKCGNPKDDFIDTKVRERCPKCKGKLMIISRKDGKKLYDVYTGLVYCVKCDFEISKDEFDKGLRK